MKDACTWCRDALGWLDMRAKGWDRHLCTHALCALIHSGVCAIQMFILIMDRSPIQWRYHSVTVMGVVLLPNGRSVLHVGTSGKREQLTIA